MTLIEVLLGSALGLTLLVLLVDVLVPMTFATQRGSVQAALQQTGLTLLDRVTLDLQRSVWSGLSYAYQPGQTILAVHRLDQLGPDGSQVYENGLVTYLWQLKAANVVRATVNPNNPSFTPSAPYQMSAANLPGLTSSMSTAPDYRVVACCVSQLDLQLDGAAFTVQMHVLLSSPVAGRSDPEQLELRRTISLRNVTL